jgi:hypothetical protein
MSSHLKYRTHFSYCCILLKLPQTEGTFEPVRSKFNSQNFQLQSDLYYTVNCISPMKKQVIKEKYVKSTSKIMAA